MLLTKRCELHVMSESHEQHIKKLYENEQVRKYLGGTVNEEVYRIRFTDMLHSKNSDLHWAVFEKGTREFMGLVFLDTYHDGVQTEIGYQFLPEFWGQGFGREVITKVIDYGFHTLALDKIVAETQSQNNGSCRLLTSVGMIVEEKLERFGNEQSRFSISIPS